LQLQARGGCQLTRGGQDLFMERCGNEQRRIGDWSDVVVYDKNFPWEFW
jgi:hypothetical protein